MILKYTRVFALLITFVCVASFSKGGGIVRLSNLFSENMVLQRNKPIKFFGTANKKTSFELEFAGKKQKVNTNDDGKWEISFAAMEAGGPYKLKVVSDSLFTWKNILIGDVWICSGQSNMEWVLRRTLNAPYELRKANHEGIRFFTVPKHASSFPLEETKNASWKTCSTENAWEFSAVAYFFARSLNERYQVPIGIIHTSWGGTPAESWISNAALVTHPDFKVKADSLLLSYKNGATIDVIQKQMYMNSSFPYAKKLLEKDKGFIEKWNKNEYSDANWKTFVVPGTLDEQGPVNYKGSIWLRKHITVPPSMNGQDLTLIMEKLNERDITYFNGTEVGRVAGFGGKRVYRIPKEMLLKGENIITIRLETFDRPAGFEAKDAAVIRLEQMVESASPTTIPLAGEWKYALGLPATAYPEQPKGLINVASLPSVLYNGMIAPLEKLPVKGFLWYQGENNAGKAFQYKTLFPLLINDWRKQFNQGDLPFIFTQLSGYGPITSEPVDHFWAELREAQTEAISLNNTGMAVTIDVGDPYDIHPLNKQVVGKRLAIQAMKTVYGENKLNTSPLYQSMKLSGDSIRIKFSNSTKGLITKDGTVPKGFAIAGADKKFVWANAKIDGDEIVVWLWKIKPVAVRYAWTGSPVESNGANVFNQEGLPLSPFRTDTWKGITEGKK
ncbi:sialate O-acetylesterase [Pedobacter hiemivivus]|uniref:9-O-acetylesterase n=1 Tax=Pedobacter hiemivivus TaxID=2530454 RepID=A0A4R0NAZ4_9SPHI|nr:sialate O-acetylesterase [Pedobacter hiemivivus]TCC96072.1 9-O-acetylesterase [Pedobacter hiemivivus]